MTFTSSLLAVGAIAFFNGILQRVMRQRQPGMTVPEKSHTESPIEVYWPEVRRLFSLTLET